MRLIPASGEPADIPAGEAPCIVRGQVWRWNGVPCLVTRTANDGSWADFRCGSSGKTWGKRMSLPLPEDWMLTNEYVVMR